MLWPLATLLLAVTAPELALAANPDIPSRLPAPQPTPADYPALKWVSSRTLVWVLAQLHLFLGAFVLAVPLFVVCIELAGVLSDDPRYDAMAHEFMTISIAAFSFTALSGGALTLALFMLYPTLMGYLARIFQGQMLGYALLFMLEAACLYLYHYSWGALRHGRRKWLHLGLGVLLNAVGTSLMFLANSWSTFMMAPSGVDASGAPTGSIWQAMHGPLWNPLNLHRFLANIAYGGAIVGAYAAYRFLSARSPEARAHYDWMGYSSNFIAVAGFLPLPFAGYWLMAEIYAYSQQMGITAMGGVLAWLFIIQAMLIGTILLAANYYLWCGLGRTERGARYAPYVKYIAVVLVGGFLVWITPHSLILTPGEVQALGGTHHQVLGPLGLMPAKNTAVNLMLVFTFLSFQLFYRSNREPTVSWARAGTAAIAALYIVGCLNIVAAGLYGYLTPTVYKVGSSVPQVLSTLSIIAFSALIDAAMLRKARKTEVYWGRMPARSQYALFVLPIAFTWTMGLMGYIRSSLRTNWHVYTIMKDTSPDAYIPSIGEVGNIITAVTLIFLGLIVFIFWLTRLSQARQPHPQAGEVAS
ncbi:MAG: cytochrome ubiquinol oxidase subunit I [Candidatus Lambdaproteobacteria bacterium]|nr:cytochrome ubiquinol oxidase subunit I [Candidatus Lambdaproteobacteria bacterium]